MMSTYGDRSSKRRRTDVKMTGFVTVKETQRSVSGLFQQRLLLKPPAFMRERGRDRVTTLPVAGAQDDAVWRPYTPVVFFAENRHWSQCVGNLAHVAGVGDLVDADGCLDAKRFCRSRVVAWIDRLRCLCHARDTGQLPNPMVSMRTRPAGDTRRRRPRHNELLWHGAKLTHETLQSMVADMRSTLASRSRACVFPYYPHIENQTDIIENYKLCILHSATPGEQSDAHMRLACMIEACCPYFFPSVPCTNTAIGDELVLAAVNEFHSRDGMESLARKFERGAQAPAQAPAPPPAAQELATHVSVPARAADRRAAPLPPPVPLAQRDQQD